MWPSLMCCCPPPSLFSVYTTHKHTNTHRRVDIIAAERWYNDLICSRPTNIIIQTPPAIFVPPPTPLPHLYSPGYSLFSLLCLVDFMLCLCVVGLPAAAVCLWLCAVKRTEAVLLKHHFIWNGTRHSNAHGNTSHTQQRTQHHTTHTAPHDTHTAPHDTHSRLSVYEARPSVIREAETDVYCSYYIISAVWTDGRVSHTHTHNNNTNTQQDKWASF